MATPAQHLVLPSRVRTIVLDGPLPRPRGTPPSISCQPLTPSWPAKDPADVLDYAFDIAPALCGNPGDAIATLDVAIAPSNPGDLSLASAAADGLRCVLWLQAGQPGTVYTVTLKIGTQNGRVLARSVLLPVIALSNSVVPADSLLTDTGAPLVDSLGEPIETGS